jgi:hypothetical protein
MKRRIRQRWILKHNIQCTANLHHADTSAVAVVTQIAISNEEPRIQEAYTDNLDVSDDELELVD